MALVEEFRDSGLQQKEFAVRHDLHLSTFQYWLYRGSKTRPKPMQIVSKSSPTFLPIEYRLARLSVKASKRFTVPSGRLPSAAPKPRALDDAGRR